MEEILNIPSLSIFNNDWNLLLKFVENEGNPPFSIDGDLNLYNKKTKTLGSLVSVGGYVSLSFSGIKDLGNLEYVGDYLQLNKTPIKSLGKLRYVGTILSLSGTPNLKITKEEIKQQVNVGAGIWGKR